MIVYVRNNNLEQAIKSFNKNLKKDPIGNSLHEIPKPSERKRKKAHRAFIRKLKKEKRRLERRTSFRG